VKFIEDVSRIPCRARFNVYLLAMLMRPEGRAPQIRTLPPILLLTVANWD
jgi:hypothetical protein